MAADRLLSGSGPEGDAAAGAAPSQGRLVGRRYRLMSPVGRGGMGMVWHAHDVLLDRDVAVKELILPYGLDHAGKQLAHRRMLREARSAARLQHPGIVTVHDVVEEDGRPWIVMELVRAWSLEQAVRQSGPLPVLQAAEIAIRVLDALMHAHAAGIMHRDIKPGNVLLTSDRVVLTDFGIAAIEGDVTITQTGLLMGSPAYIPPERLSGRAITQAADLWSFGATLYAAVEGRPPYEGPDPVAVLGQVLTQAPITPQRAGSLLPVIEGLLRKNPAERLTAPQVVEMLEAVLRAHGSVRPRAPEPLPSPAEPVPADLLPPLDTPSGPMPSRIVETPSGPVRVPYDPLTSPSGGHAMPYDGLSTPSGSHRTDQLPRPQGFGDPGGPGRPFAGGTGPRVPARDLGPGLDADPDDDLIDGPGPHPRPILPLTTDSRSAGPADTPWPLASPDDLREHSRGLTDDLRPGRLTRLPAAAPRTGRSRRRAEDDDGLWMRDGRPTPLTIAGSLVLVGGAIVAAVLGLSSGGSPTPAAGPPAATATARTLQSEPSAAPDGYREQTSAGFTVAVPENWKLTAAGGLATFAGPKDSGLRAVVEDATPEDDGGLAELSHRESEGGRESYIQVQLQAVNYRGWKAADWEYTYTTAAGVPMHALTRYVTLDDATAFTITFDVPELKWDEQADMRKVFLDTFRKTT
ncbi:Serine/threonine-protein kinase PrkC [Nonomuraea coxensis DSM 45129]|uniref:non-specific serine/threonine protein kinase n=1 Tax=Nonomuraea coxensis DSM 45129 TaxID=1122611 RepID=A0ABX8U9U6_9ACTN|nr:serine/threonine-protein kinase [Nonomuraea coxensis]QYC43514.1 Serine/threonine-protein kinase PrkC [Nonomuraea coxensis DSM 45129]